MSGATAPRTFRPSATTSGPMPSPAITASRMGTNPRSERVEIGRPGLARTDPLGHVGEQFGGHGAVDDDRHQRLATPRRAADLRTRDVDAGLPQRRPHAAHDAR